jgi:hypothetical protein
VLREHTKPATADWFEAGGWSRVARRRSKSASGPIPVVDQRWPNPWLGGDAVWLTREAGAAGDPSLRLKGGSARDDAFQIEPLPTLEEAAKSFGARAIIGASRGSHYYFPNVYRVSATSSTPDRELSRRQDRNRGQVSVTLAESAGPSRASAGCGESWPSAGINYPDGDAKS